MRGRKETGRLVKKLFPWREGEMTLAGVGAGDEQWADLASVGRIC